MRLTTSPMQLTSSTMQLTTSPIRLTTSLIQLTTSPTCTMFFIFLTCFVIFDRSCSVNAANTLSPIRMHNASASSTGVLRYPNDALAVNQLPLTKADAIGLSGNHYSLRYGLNI